MLVRISTAAGILGVCIKTLQRWDNTGALNATARTAGNHRRYDTRLLAAWLVGDREGKNSTGEHEKTGKEKRQKTVIPQRALIYARVSSNKQKEDLIRQLETLENHCQQQGYTVNGIYKDTASGLNDRRSGLLRLLREVMAGGIDRVVITYPDRLARFGTNIIRQVLACQNTLLDCCGIIKSNGESGIPVKTDPHRELVDDVIALLTSFAGKLHRLRRGKGKKMQGNGGKKLLRVQVTPPGDGVPFPAG